jgi:hypothetical protein
MFDFVADLLGHLFGLFGQAGSARAWSILIGLLVLTSVACALMFWLGHD